VTRAATPPGIIMPKSAPKSDTSGRLFLIFVDDASIEPSLTPQLKQVIEDIKNNLVHDEDTFGVLSSGPSSIEIDLTHDKHMLDEAKSKAMGSGMKPDDIISAPMTSQGPSGLRHQAALAFRTMYDQLRLLEQVRNRRKIFILISCGWDFNPFPQGRQKYDQER